jgi:hypothetical protein
VFYGEPAARARPKSPFFTYPKLDSAKAGQRNRLKSKGLSTLGTIDRADWADYADIAFSATGVYDLFNLFHLRHLGFLAKSSEGDS